MKHVITRWQCDVQTPVKFQSSIKPHCTLHCLNVIDIDISLFYNKINDFITFLSLIIVTYLMIISKFKLIFMRGVYHISDELF